MRTRSPDAWRLAVGTLTVVPVKPPRSLDRPTAGLAMVVAPLAVLPLGVLAGLLTWSGREAGVPPLAIGLLVVGGLALGTRVLHLDGLADTVDGLSASHEAERSLAVMRSSDIGPAGVVALVVIGGGQAALLGALAEDRWGPVTVGMLVCLSRVALPVACVHGMPAARPDGLGATVAATVPVPVATGSVVAATAVAAATTSITLASWPAGIAGVALAGILVAVLLLRVRHRVGGITGDVLGAAVEVSLLGLLLGVVAVG